VVAKLHEACELRRGVASTTSILFSGITPVFKSSEDFRSRYRLPRGYDQHDVIMTPKNATEISI
jgi:hypothetical protein